MSKENTASIEADGFEVAAVWIRASVTTDEKQPMTKGEDYQWSKEEENQKKSKSLRGEAREKLRGQMKEEENKKTKVKARREKVKIRYFAEGEIAISGHEPIMVEVAVTPAAEKSAEEIIKEMISDQAWGGMIVDQTPSPGMAKEKGRPEPVDVAKATEVSKSGTEASQIK